MGTFHKVAEAKGSSHQHLMAEAPTVEPKGPWPSR